jgi:hypothetical protein
MLYYYYSIHIHLPPPVHSQVFLLQSSLYQVFLTKLHNKQKPIMMDDEIDNHSSSFANMIHFHSDSTDRRCRSNSIDLPRPFSEQMMQASIRRSAPLFPRTHSMLRRNHDVSLGKSSSHEKLQPRPRSQTPSRRRNGAASSIVQRSSSKFIKSTLLDLEHMCDNTECTQDSMLFALKILKEHVVDSYYRVILRKHRGVETLQQVALTFSSFSQVVTLCKSILETLQQDSDGVDKSCSMMNGMVVDFHSDSPKTVVSDIPEDGAAPVLSAVDS